MIQNKDLKFMIANECTTEQAIVETYQQTFLHTCTLKEEAKHFFQILLYFNNFDIIHIIFIKTITIW